MPLFDVLPAGCLGEACILVHSGSLGNPPETITEVVRFSASNGPHPNPLPEGEGTSRGPFLPNSVDLAWIGIGGRYKMNRVSEFCRRFPPPPIARKKVCHVSVWSLGVRFLPVALSPDRHSPRWPRIGRNGAAAMPETWSPTKRACRLAFEPGKKRSDGSGIDLRTTCNVRWVAKLGSENYSSPVVADGKVFIGTNDAGLDDPRYKPTGGGLLLCLDEATGKRLWQLPVPKLARRPPQPRFRRDEPGHLFHAHRRRRSRLRGDQSLRRALPGRRRHGQRQRRAVRRRAALHGRAGPAAGGAQAGRRRHHLGVRHAQPAAGLSARCGQLLAAGLRRLRVRLHGQRHRTTASRPCRCRPA